MQQITITEIPLSQINEHPVLGKIYPDLEGREMEDFDADIERAGQIVPAKVMQAAKDRYYLLDGKQRYLSAKRRSKSTLRCEIISELRVGDRTVSIDQAHDDDLIRWAESLNERRRHLSHTGQARKYLARKDSLGVRHGGAHASDTGHREQAARESGYGSYKSAERDAAVLDAVPEVQELYDKDQISQKEAVELSRRPPAEQKRQAAKIKREVAANGNGKQQKKKEEPKTAAEKHLEDFSILKRRFDNLFDHMEESGLIDEHGAPVEGRMATLLRAGKKTIGDAEVWLARPKILARAIRVLGEQANNIIK